MKRSLIAAGVLVAFANATPALAGNWVDAIGTEPADSPKFRFFGFVQPTYTYYLADRMSGGNAQNKNTRVTLNYEWRDQEVPHVSAITNAAQRTNALVVADNTADRVSLQLTYWW